MAKTPFNADIKDLASSIKNLKSGNKSILKDLESLESNDTIGDIGTKEAKVSILTNPEKTNQIPEVSGNSSENDTNSQNANVNIFDQFSDLGIKIKTTLPSPTDKTSSSASFSRVYSYATDFYPTRETDYSNFELKGKKSKNKKSKSRRKNRKNRRRKGKGKGNSARQVSLDSSSVVVSSRLFMKIVLVNFLILN